MTSIKIVAIETYMNNFPQSGISTLKSESKLFFLNVQFDYDMPVLCTDLGIFQFCIFGNDTNKANIRKNFSFFCFLHACKKQDVSDHYF